MPGVVTPVKKKKSSHRGFFGSITHGLGVAAHGTSHVATGTGKGLYHGVTGLPTGVYMSGRAIGHDLGSFYRHPLRKRQFTHTEKLGKTIGKSEYEAWKHFGKGGDVSGPALDLLALLSLGGGSATRITQAAKAASKTRYAGKALKTGGTHLDKAVVRESLGHPYTREEMHKAKITPADIKAHKDKYGEHLTARTFKGTMERGDVRKAAIAGLKKKPYYSRQAKYVGEVPVSPNPVFRSGRKLREAARRKTPTKNFARRELQNRQRTLDQIGHELGLPPRTRPRKLPAEKTINRVAQITGLPMNALRFTMVMRPRYTVQNVFQDLTMLGVHPVKAIKGARMLVKDPELRKMAQGATGGGIARATVAEAAGPGARAVGKMFDIANWPEQKLRAVSMPVQFMEHGIKDPAEMKRLIHKALKEGIVGSKQTQRTHGILKKTEEEMGAFGRRTPGESAFMRTQIPIFYPMYKALLRYGYRFPSEHSAIAAGALATGKTGKREQHRLLGDLPYWAQYLIPKGAGDPNAKPGPRQAVFNPANIYNIQPAADITQQLAEPIRKGGPRPGVNVLQETGPLGQIIYALSTGKDLQTGYPIITKNTPDWQRYSLMAALADYLQGIPGADISRAAIGFPKRHLRSYEPGSQLNAILQQLAGPAFIPRTLLTKETTKQARREAKIGRTHKQKKHQGD